MTAQTIRKFHQFKRAMEIAIELMGVETPITTITIGDRQGEATYTLPPEIVWSSTNAGILKWMTEKYEQKTLTSMSGWQGFFSQWQECIGEKVELFW